MVIYKLCECVGNNIIWLNLKYIGKNILNHDLEVKKGNVSGSSSSTGSFGLAQIGGTDINPTGVARDQVLKFNGTKFVPAHLRCYFCIHNSRF